MFVMWEMEMEDGEKILVNAANVMLMEADRNNPELMWVLIANETALKVKGNLERFAEDLKKLAGG